MEDSDPGLIVIRPLKAWQEYLDAEELQLRVWQMPDWRDVVPANLLITAHKNGGILLGAFTPDRLVGFVFSFLGTHADSGRTIVKHCSHMLAVLPEFQGQQIGERLKFSQRQESLAQQVVLMTWTYDPLLSLNANLNLSRLGAIARQYVVSAYGDMTDALNAGLPSDRLQVEWWLRAPRVEGCAVAPPPRSEWDALLRSAQPIHRVDWDTRGLPRPGRVHVPEGERVWMEIPFNIMAVKSSDPELALTWRLQTRQVLQSLFQDGYAAVDFVFSRTEPRRAAYILSRASLDLGPSNMSSISF